MTFKVGTLGIDSGSAVSPAEAAKSGAKFMLRYSAGAASLPGNSSHGENKWKLCGENEIADIIKHVDEFLANDEWYTNRSVEGYRAGQEDGKAILEFWQSRGLNRGATIRGNLDTGSGNVSQIQHYIDGVNNSLDGYYIEDGFYAGLPILLELAKSGHVKHGWIPMAASWSFPKNSRVELPSGARRSWDMWGLHGARLAEAGAYIADKLGPAGLDSCIWQNGNRWFNGAADEDMVIISGNMGGHVESGSGENKQPHNPPKSDPTKPADDSHHTIPSGHHKYKIENGDTFWDLEEHNDWPHGTLQKLNPGVDPKSLDIGQDINVPGKAKPKPAPKPAPHHGAEHKIRKGETFWELEEDNNWAHGTLTDLNPGVNPRKLKVGQEINVPGKAKPRKKYHTHTIVKGDTFWDLEEKHHWKHGTLEGLNPDLNPKSLSIGEKIRTP